MVVHRPTDPLLPGAKPLIHLGPGAQLYVRTQLHAYTVYLRAACSERCIGAHIIDEALFDHTADENEMVNLAYSADHAHIRARLLRIIQREWQVHLISTAAPNRSARMRLVARLANCSVDVSKLCPVMSGTGTAAAT